MRTSTSHTRPVAGSVTVKRADSGAVSSACTLVVSRPLGSGRAAGPAIPADGAGTSPVQREVLGDHARQVARRGGGVLWAGGNGSILAAGAVARVMMSEPASGVSDSELVRASWSGRPVPPEDEGWTVGHDARLALWSPGRGTVSR